MPLSRHTHVPAPLCTHPALPVSSVVHLRDSTGRDTGRHGGCRRWDTGRHDGCRRCYTEGKPESVTRRVNLRVLHGEVNLEVLHGEVNLEVLHGR